MQNTDFLIGLLQKQFLHKEVKSLNTRTRAAPFFNELAPGWRARARDLAPPYGRNAECRWSSRKEDTDADSVDSLGSLHDQSPPGSMLHRTRKGKGKARKKQVVDMEHEQGGIGRSRKEGTWDESHESREGDGADPSREDSECQGSSENGGGSTSAHSTGTRRHEEGGAEARGSSSRSPRTRAVDTSEDDCAHSGRCRDEEDAQPSRAEFYQLDHGSGSEYERSPDDWPGRGLGDARSAEDREKQVKPSVFRWAADFVVNATDRSKTLVNRVLSVGTKNADIASDAAFAKSICNKESWTQVTKDAVHYDGTIMQGLQDPVWRQTVAVETGEVLESQPVTQVTEFQKVIPNGPVDIKQTVWYGNVPDMPSTKPKSRVLKNLFKGIRSVAAIFLLEALVLMSATSQWSGAWTQKLYGTGQADVWEVFGSHKVLTKVS